MSDTAPSPARDRRQLEVVQKEIDEPTHYVLDLGTCLSSGIAICDDVDNSLLTSPSAVTYRRPDYSPVDDALSTCATTRGHSNYPEAGDAFPAFSVRTRSTNASAFGRIDMTLLSLFIYLCVMNVMSSIMIVSSKLSTWRVDDVVLWVMELLCSVLMMRAMSCDKAVSDRTMSAVMRCHDVWLFNTELVWDVLMRLLRCREISGDRLMDRIRVELISGLSMLILMRNLITLAVCLEVINVVLMFEARVSCTVSLGLMLACMKSDLILECIETEGYNVKSDALVDVLSCVELLSS